MTNTAHITSCIELYTATTCETFYLGTENNKSYPMCPECEQGLHTYSQVKSCKTQNKNLRATKTYLKHYYPRSWFLRILF